MNCIDYKTLKNHTNQMQCMNLTCDLISFFLSFFFFLKILFIYFSEIYETLEPVKCTINFTFKGYNSLVKNLFFFKDFIYLFDRDRDSQREREHKQGEWERKRERQPAREGTQAGGVGEEEAGSQRRSLMWGSIPGP